MQLLWVVMSAPGKPVPVHIVRRVAPGVIACELMCSMWSRTRKDGVTAAVFFLETVFPMMSSYTAGMIWRCMACCMM